MSSIKYFLSRQLYGTGDHPNGWNKYVYDDENIHYGLLQILLEDCHEFAKYLFDIPSTPVHIKITPKPDNGIFDMLAVVDGQAYYVEVKIWACLSEEQFSRQIEYVKANGGHGCFVLFRAAADKWSPETVLRRSDNCCRVIGGEELRRALNMVTAFSNLELAEIAEAYKFVVRDIPGR